MGVKVFLVTNFTLSYAQDLWILSALKKHVMLNSIPGNVREPDPPKVIQLRLVIEQ